MEETGPDGSKNQGAKKDKLNLGEWIVALFFMYVLFWLLPADIWDFIPAKLKYPVVYSIAHHISLGSVQVATRPSDCDWGHAPLGDKGCSYEKHVFLVRGTKGQVVGVLLDWRKVAK